jgi:hypothetical protein
MECLAVSPQALNAAADRKQKAQRAADEGSRIIAAQLSMVKTGPPMMHSARSANVK